MNVVFFSPHFPPNMWLYCQRLAAQGATVLGIADAPYDSLRAELKGSLDGYYQVHDLHNGDDLVRALGWFTHEHGKIDRLESLNEYWLETDAFLRTEFNIPGIKTDSIARIKRKSAMKKVFVKAGIPVARGKAVRTDREAKAFIKAVGYPVIAKPDVGVGAAKTYRIDDDAALAGFLSDRPTIDYFLEEWLDGQLLSYDGLADRHGKIVFEASITYGISVLEALAGPDMSYWLEREIPNDLREIGQRTAKAFDVRERPFHFEFFRMADGSYRAVEVNMRQPGGYTVDMWNYQNDADVYRAWAQIMVHGTTDIENRRPFAVLWAGRKRGRSYRMSRAEIDAAYGPLVIQHLRVDDVFADAMGHEGYVLRGPDIEPLRAAAAAIHERA
ncbi:MAG TPA: carboxylate--amine ligase [Candidatus Polarisedimenticolia bacterium]|nr:carboxylate--amine ligase [Candidatus Polarisedimenticolia bacterium]